MIDHLYEVRRASDGARIWIGRTINPTRRLRQHQRRWKDVAFRILVKASLQYVRLLESRLIASAFAAGEPLENVLLGDAVANVGMRLSPLTRARIGAAHKGRPHSIECCRKLSLAKRGRKLSAEHRASIGAAGRGVPKSSEHRLHIGKALRGHEVSLEVRAKISASLTGKPLTKARRQKISEALRGKSRRPLSPEHRAKLSAANKGRVWSPASLAALSQSLRGRRLSPEHRSRISVAISNLKKQGR